MPFDVSRPGLAPASALALWLTQQAAQRGRVLHVAADTERLDAIASAAHGFASPGLDVLVLPAWDVLPYDQLAPSPGLVGRRVATLRRLAVRPGRSARPTLVLISSDSALQRVQPRSGWRNAVLTLRAGAPVELAALMRQLAELGYRHLDESVDSPGEVAVRGQVIDLFPADAAQPIRLELADNRIAELRLFDAATQRSLEEVDSVEVMDAVEFPPDEEDTESALQAIAGAGPDAATASLPEPPERLISVFDYLDGFAASVDPGVEERCRDARDAIDDAFATAGMARCRDGAGGMGILPPPKRLYLKASAVATALNRLERLDPAADASFGQPLAEPPPARIAGLIRQLRAVSGTAVVACNEPRRIAAALVRAGLDARVARDWADAREGPLACLALDIAVGFSTGTVSVLPAPRLAARQSAYSALAGNEAPRPGDLVVHLGHGLARLRGLAVVGGEERVSLEYAGETDLLIPTDELRDVWRYGDTDAVSLDRLAGDAWTRRREELDTEMQATAQRLAEQAAARTKLVAPELSPPRDGMARLARRFAFQPSPDQQAAITAVLDDLARARPMDRLVCGDVGFGKTEVALRALAAAALSGWQAVLVAPTTVLARQHLDTVRRRFENTGIRVEGLFGAVRDRGTRALRDAVASGKVHILVGTQAAASADLRFHRLGLVVVDEEQRFGEALKTRMAGLRSVGKGTGELVPHALTMTATPIPRTMQSAMAGLREVSVIATAPVRRQPTRTIVLPWNPVTVYGALTRERGRGGQSFVVCPRIEDLARWAERLKEIVPDLRVVQAHGRMKPEALEEAVVGFAQGRGDVLLATNIIEAGLDIPRANTILVTDADRFGLAQLHQLRGRVGRGARRGVAYLMTEPGRRMATATDHRLRTMEAVAGLGVGARIALADLDLRGAGDLFGERQAGHIRAIGTGLYQHLLGQAVAASRKEPLRPPLPELHIGLEGRIPEDWVPEEELRLTLYHRLAHMAGADAVDAFAEELDDRFGSLPDAAQNLLAAAKLRCLGAANGLARIDAGPQAVALTPHTPWDLPELAANLGGTVKGERLILSLAIEDARARTARLTALLRVDAGN